MRIIFMGSPAFAVHPLQALVTAGYTLAAVITQPDRPAGRKRVLTPPPVKVAALDLGIPVLQPETLRDPAVIQQLNDLAPNVGVVAAYGEILRKTVLAIPPLGYLNIHPSILPLHRGPVPVVGAILAGDTETGVSIMKLNRGMDSGPLLAQERIPMPTDARAGDLNDQLFVQGATMLPDVLRRYANGEIIPREQDHSQATVTRLLKKTDGLLDWSQAAVFLERCVRAYDPWPGAYTHWHGQQVKVWSAAVHTDWLGAEDTLPGTIIGVDTNNHPLVATGNGALALLTIQPAGKRAMGGKDWLAGQRDVVGQQFG